jgi:hypothetical protein
MNNPHEEALINEVVITSVREDGEGGYVLNDSLGIPNDPDSHYFKAIQNWIDEGNTPTSADPSPAPVIDVVTITKLQCKKQAVIEGLWDTLKTAITNDAEIKENWDLATGLEINDPDVQAMGVIMGKTPEELQTFFNNAAVL